MAIRIKARQSVDSVTATKQANKTPSGCSGNQPSIPLSNRGGRPSSGKKLITLRLDPAIIEKFRATGPGWQARINEALRKA